MSKVLKIIGDIDVSANLPEDAEVITMKLDDYMVTEYEEQFDIILCIHVLQTMWAFQIPDVIEKMVKDLKERGEIHVHVPATEYAAKTLIKAETDPISFYLIWGTKDRPFHTGFTLLWLRALLTQAGAIVRKANLGLFHFQFNEKEVRAPEHVVVATVIRD